MNKRRSFTRDFKLEVLNELNVKPAIEVCREHNLHPVMISRWRKEFRQNPDKAFSGNGNLWKIEAELEKYKRLVGQLYAENDFLKKTMKKLQELNAEEEKMRSLR